jgi:WD repeat-containing protein 68
VIAMDQNYLTILDTRMPLTPVCKLENHRECVNAIAWAP